MKSFDGCILTIAAGLLLATATYPQTPVRHNVRAQSPSRLKLTLPPEFLASRTPRTGTLAFIASEEGRSFLKATGHPLAKYAIARWGEPSKTTVVPAPWLEQANEARQQLTSAPDATSTCDASNGTRFNLEPRANATMQTEAMADFLPNRIGPADDLIVQAANDWRGNLPSKTWDNSISGYYVHTSSKADCSVQFEGGLPNFTSQGNSYIGIGDTVVAADPARDAFFMADTRFGGDIGVVALFRASASNLLDAKTCPHGTHLQAQAESCWMATPPVALFDPNLNADLPRIAVDERATGAGTGAGDVYVVAASSSIYLAACTNSLNCGNGQGIIISGSDSFPQFPYAQVRPDGVVTVSYISFSANGSPGADIKFVSCTPAGAPNPPVCSAPTLVQHLTQNLVEGEVQLTTLQNFGLLVNTFPKHTNRAESGGAFTTFLVYDDCLHQLAFDNPPTYICLDAEVMMTASTDNGKTWSKPVSADTASGHHFLPAITTDGSTGIVHFTYYSAEGDKFNHAVRVFRNQIAPGTVSLGSPVAVTMVADTIDDSFNNAFLFDWFMGAIARGNSASGKSRLYMSFDSTLVPGTYKGSPAADANNNIIQVSY